MELPLIEQQKKVQSNSPFFRTFSDCVAKYCYEMNLESFHRPGFSFYYFGPETNNINRKSKSVLVLNAIRPQATRGFKGVPKPCKLNLFFVISGLHSLSFGFCSLLLLYFLL